MRPLLFEFGYTEQYGDLKANVKLLLYGSPGLGVGGRGGGGLPKAMIIKLDAMVKRGLSGESEGGKNNRGVKNLKTDR